MGQNNDTAEHGEPQGQQGGSVPLSPAERARQSGYAISPVSDAQVTRNERMPGGAGDKPK